MYNGITFLRAIAAFLIVGCHLQLFPRTTGGSIVTSLCYMNVGLFAAISGFVMVCSLDNNSALGEYFWKRAKRLLPIYVVWTVFYLLASLVFAVVIKGGVPTERYSNWRFWLDVVVWGGASCHLWFVICLFYANVLLGSCYALCRRFKHVGLVFMSLGLIFVGCATVSRTFMLIYPCRLFGFVSLGMAMRLALDNMRISRLASFVLMAGSFVAYFILLKYIHPFLRDIILVFTILLWFSRKNMPLYGGKIIERLAKCSMGVFLIHPFFAAGMAVIIPRFVSQPFGVSIVLSDWLAVYILALIGTMAMMRVPLLERLIK